MTPKQRKIIRGITWGDPYTPEARVALLNLLDEYDQMYKTIEDAIKQNIIDSDGLAPRCGCIENIVVVEFNWTKVPQGGQQLSYLVECCSCKATWEWGNP